MAIPERQLEVWAKQGSVTQSKSTYATIRNALDASDAVYRNRSYDIFPMAPLNGQGANQAIQDANALAARSAEITVTIWPRRLKTMNSSGRP